MLKIILDERLTLLYVRIKERIFTVREKAKEREGRKNDMKKVAASLIAVLFIVFGFIAGEAKADMIYDLKYIFNGSTNINGSDWLTADFQTINTGQVKLTLTSNLTDPSYYIQDVAFNVAPTVTPGSMLFNVDSASGTTLSQANILHTDQNAQTLIGSGNMGAGFDVLFKFQTPNQNRFNGNDSVVLTITGQNITEDSFKFLNTAGAANVGAHLAGGSMSSAITDVNPSPVPIPAAVWLFGSGLIGLVGVRRRFSK